MKNHRLYLHKINLYTLMCNSIVYFILLMCCVQFEISAQPPVNDRPCDAIDIGMLDINNSVFFQDGNNVGAGNGNGIFNIYANYTDFESCRGFDGWNNTVFYKLTLDQGISGIRATLTPKGNQQFYMMIVGINYCTNFPYDGTYSGAVNGSACAQAPGEVITVSDDCLINSRFFADQAVHDDFNGEIMLMVGSEDGEEGEFELLVDPILPTYCDGCKNGDETEIDGPYEMPEPENIVGAFETGDNGKFSLDINAIIGGLAPYTVSLDNGFISNDGNFENLVPGEYLISVEDVNGCIITRTVEIPERILNPPVLNEEIPQYCVGDIVAPFNITGENLKLYSDENLTIEIGEEDIFNTTATESNTFYVTQTIEGIESDALIVELQVEEVPDKPVISSPYIFCEDETIEILLNANGFDLKWYDSADLSNLVNNGTSYISENKTNHTLWVTASSEFCESEPTEIVIQVENKPEVPNIDFQSFVCAGVEVPEIEVLWEDDKVNWYTDEELNDLIYTGNTYTPGVITEDTDLWITVANNSCVSEASNISISVGRERPEIEELIYPKSICTGEDIEVTAIASQEFEIFWYTDELKSDLLHTGNKFEITNLQADKTYWVLASNANCESELYEVFIEVIPLPEQPVITSPDPACNTENEYMITAQVSEGTISWYLDEGLSKKIGEGENILLDNKNLNTLWLTTTIGNCTSEVVEFNFDIAFPEALFNVEKDEGILPFTVQFENESDNARIFIWDFGDGNNSTLLNPEHIYETPGEYTVTLTAISEDNCTDIFEYSYINVLEELIIPNGISPNFDQVNDIWIIENIDQFAGNSVKIFNQWGNVVFEAVNYENNWQADQLPDGTYFYLIDLNNGKTPLQGFITVIR